MTTYDVMDANRKVKRDIQKVFGDSFLKIITEIILNSDDSYNRIDVKKQAHRKLFGSIIVKLNRRTNVLRFLDQAEGMSLAKMSDMFRLYGGDYSQSAQTKNVRGLFGQGASDVLFLSAFHQYPSYIISVHDGKASKCTFIFDEQKQIHLQELPNVEKVRKETGILKDGTLVVFGLPSSVKIPKQKEMKEKIESFYMMRYILSSPDRSVVFYDGDLKHRLDASRYMFGPDTPMLINQEILLSLDALTIKSRLKLYQTKATDDRQIIIKDEYDIVYEESMFGLEKLHSAKRFSGEFIIEGIGDILRAYLNKEKPEEILRDSRDGFDRRHRFTIDMVNKVTKVLHHVMMEVRAQKQDTHFSLNKNKQITKALHKTNEYFEELTLSPIYEVDELGLTEEKLRFAREVISITEGKRYGLHLYINPLFMGESEIISLELEDNPYVDVTNNQLSLQDLHQNHDGLFIKHIIIKAKKKTPTPICLTAKTSEGETSVLINVVREKVIYPENGLCFSPKRKVAYTGKKSSIKLFFDTAFIPLKSSILINQHYESMLFPEAIEIYTREKHLITDTIGMIKVPIVAHQYEEHISLSATSFDIVTKATCIVKGSNTAEAIFDGLINNIELVFEEGDFQARMLEEERILQINGEHIINQKNIGDLKHKNPSNPSFDESELCYLYELMALESSKQYVIEKYRNLNELADPDHMLREIQEHKTKIYTDLIKQQ